MCWILLILARVDKLSTGTSLSSSTSFSISEKLQLHGSVLVHLVGEDSRLLGCDTASLLEWVSTF